MLEQSLQYVQQACAITDCAGTFDSERVRSRSLGDETSMKANSEKTKQSKKATRRVLAGVLCGASVLSLVLSLVMPPISQAIANDAQAAPTEETVMGGSSTESTDVDNTTNGDTENQNGDEAKGDETGDDASEAVPLSDDTEADGAAQPADDGADDENAIAPAAENESTYEISSGAELSSKLLNESLRINGAATFKLTNNIDYNDEIRLDGSSTNITLDLNGYKIKHADANKPLFDANKPLFDVANGAALTVVDSAAEQEAVDGGQELQNQGESLTTANYGKNGEVDHDNDGIPTTLTYYVTKSYANGARTTETLETHTVNIKGAIVSTAPKGSALKLINVYAGGKFNLQGGTLTQKKDCNVGNLIYAEDGSTVNIRGGYVCGASTGTSGTGAGIMVNTNGNASTLNLTGGVIAANYAPQGAGVYSAYSNVSISENAVISGNATFDGASDSAGYGGGIMAVGGSVTVSGGYITNNRMAKYCGKKGWGCHGGGGLAANEGAQVTISGGQITGNYSEEAGGGVYVTDVNRNEQSRTGMAWLNITGGIIASNVSNRSEGAGVRVGQMVDAMIKGSSTASPVYITNNHCMSRFDWGGGGIFVQGNSNEGKEYTAGRLFVYNSYISTNNAGGYGGGVAVCPTGKTLVTNTEGTAIFGNTSAGSEQSPKDYDSDKNTGNDGAPHLSGGGHNKIQDSTAYNSQTFRENGHKDFFLAAEGHNDPIAAVIGTMLGGGDAKYSGSIELTDRITIPANGGVQVKNSIGLSSGVNTGDDAAKAAQKDATTFITGNYSWNHGGGIMSNGDLYLGQPADTYAYPSLKLKATKALSGRALKAGEFSFTVYRKDSDSATAPNWNNKTFSNGGCTFVGSAKNSADGNITFDLGEQFLASGTDEITYYLVEDAGKVSGVDYDHAVYEIKVTVEDRTTVLMSVPTQNDPTATKDLKVHNYTIKSVNVVKNPGASAGLSSTVSADDDGYYSITNSDGFKTFTNTYTKYTSTGSWTPKATKVVKGGEMKEFTLEFADNEKFEDAKAVKTTADGTNKPQTLSFVDKITYKLNDLNKGEDPTGRGASKTFTYYVREQQPTTPFTNYKYDKSVYKITVTATDQSDKTIKCDVTYTKIVDAEGKEIPEDKRESKLYGEDASLGQSLPTFTNTYSTSLPLSGMSGVTLTYLAGAAVLCAAAAWMHIRRKANAKGGERRE